MSNDVKKVNKTKNAASGKKTTDEMKFEAIEKVSSEDMLKIKEARAKAAHLTNIAEKAYANAKVAELEATNLILTVMNKYRLNVLDGDNILEDGTIKLGNKNG